MDEHKNRQFLVTIKQYMTSCTSSFKMTLKKSSCHNIIINAISTIDIVSQTIYKYKDKLGPFILAQINYHCAVYDVCKYLGTLWPESCFHLFAQCTILLLPLCRSESIEHIECLPGIFFHCVSMVKSLLPIIMNAMHGAVLSTY